MVVLSLNSETGKEEEEEEGMKAINAKMVRNNMLVTIFKAPASMIECCVKQ